MTADTTVIILNKTNGKYSVEVATGNLRKQDFDVSRTTSYDDDGNRIHVRYTVTADTTTRLSGPHLQELMDTIVPAIEANEHQDFPDEELRQYLLQNAPSAASGKVSEGRRELDQIALKEAEEADELISHSMKLEDAVMMKLDKTVEELTLLRKLSVMRTHMGDMRATLLAHATISDIEEGR